MDVNRLYLLIILVLSPDMSKMNPSRMCDRGLIRLYVTFARVMEKEAAQCSDLPPLPVPITLPNVAVTVADWKNKTEFQQGTEVLSHLDLLLNAAQKLKITDCISHLLVKLSRKIKETRGIVKKALQMVRWSTALLQEGGYHGFESDSLTSPPQEVSLLPMDDPHTSTSDSTEIFSRFHKLLQGKVSLLLQRLREASCR
ncbi:thrombopoietin isoform X1 [Ascaphus truei]|uniref:thrombopoietin isoform X1 n=1 Tax=Ascaphus truei TaxID=8439 RepID=UPI003F599C9D